MQRLYVFIPDQFNSPIFLLLSTMMNFSQYSLAQFLLYVRKFYYTFIKLKKNILENRRMLPSLKKSQTILQDQQCSQINTKKTSMSSSKISKQIEHIMNHEDKYQQELLINNKLKKHLNNLRSSNETSTKVNQEQNQVILLTKQQRKLENQVQYQEHSLNILISENSKLKSQVDAQRNKRAIYFNVYKNLEHQIHQWESKYKNILIQSMKSEGVITKVQQKFRKVSRKVEKDLQNLKQQIERISKFEIQSNSTQSRQMKAKNIKQQFIQSKQKQNNKNSAVFVTSSEKGNQQKSFHHSQSVHQNRKSFDPELEYQIQQKSIEIEGLSGRIRQICGVNDLNQCCKLYKNIGDDIQYNFDLFKSEESRQKQLTQKLNDLENELIKLENQNLQRKHSTQITNVKQSAQRQNCQQKISQLQSRLQQKLGVKIEKFTNQMLLHHCLRVREQKKGKKNLQKYLQQTKKQKPQYNLLLTPKQMYKNIIQNQASSN